MRLILTLSLAVAAAHPAVAQVGTRHGLTLDGARRVIASAQVEARKLNAPGGVVAVVDEGGNLMALERLDGTFAAGANISIGKARTAVLFKKPMKVFKGSVLFDGAGDRNYMLHASRRDSAGLVEVHAKDTDIIYVLDGAATVVTGGKVVDGKETAADEVRGKSIDSGERRRLAKGDVMIVPNGTPHWFQEVRAPFTYYVVKVR